MDGGNGHIGEIVIKFLYYYYMVNKMIIMLLTLID